MLESAAFRIPVAREARGRLVAPEEADKGRRYVCPACGGAVDLHAGARKKRHFHHRSAACSEESVLHLSAKALVVQAEDEWLAGGAAPVFVRRCTADRCARTCRQKMPKKIVRAAEEFALASGHVVDVGLLGRADLPVAAIEIRFSHAVDDEKGRELGVPWIEVDAAQVCEDGGRVLVAVRDRFLPWFCEEHEGRRGQDVKEERAERLSLARLVRELPYRLDDFPGFRAAGVSTCPAGHETLVFAWDGREPPWPRPPHVVACERDADVLFDSAARMLRSTFPFRRSWASACVKCGARLA